VCNIVIKKFTFAISSPDEFLFVSHWIIVSSAASHLVSTSGVYPVKSRRRALQQL